MGEQQTRQEISVLLEAWRDGDSDAPKRLFPLVYRELRGVAHRQLARRPPVDSLATTGLVNELYLRLVDQQRAKFKDRGHFFAIASTAMRQILVDHARKRMTKKRGGELRRTTLDEGRASVEERAAEVVALDHALKELEQLEPRLSRMVELRFFGGLSVVETAETLDLSTATVKRDWRKARAFLHDAIGQEG